MTRLLLLLVAAGVLGALPARANDEAGGAADPQPVLMAPMGHSQMVLSAVFSPNGRYVLTGADDTTAQLWETATGREVRRFEGHEKGVYAVALLPRRNAGAHGIRRRNGKVVGGRHGAGGAPPRGSRRRRSRGFLPARRPLRRHGIRRHVGTAVGDGDRPGARTLGRTHGWCARRRRLPRRRSGPDELLRSHGARCGRRRRGRRSGASRGTGTPCARSPSRPTAPTSSPGIRDLTPRACGRRRRARRSERFEETTGMGSPSVAFSPDGTHVLTGSRDGSARLWDTATGRRCAASRATRETCTPVAFSPDGTHVLTGAYDRTARLWETATGSGGPTLRGTRYAR